MLSIFAGGKKKKGVVTPEGPPVTPPAPPPPPVSAAVTGLDFPSNVTGADKSAPYVAIQFVNPHINGLPIWGPGNAGTTWIWKIKHRQQQGYYVTFWWVNNTGVFLWKSGSSDTYYGCHPYPQSANNSGATHWWELAGMDPGADNLNTRAGVKKVVTYDVVRTQAFRATYNADTTKTGIFYTDLPSVANADVIERVSPASFGEVNPPEPAVVFGDSPWYASFQHERLSGILGPVKIFAKSLSEGNMIAEAADMTQLVTPEGIANIWWGKKSFKSVDDLTCDYGTGRTFTWADPANKATIATL